jgi:predicted LPLAT superfamily acyltransferase
MPQNRRVERQRGNRLGFWFFRQAVRLFGLGGAYVLLYGVGLHYLIFDRPIVAASLAYVKRRFPAHGPLRRLVDVYLLFVSQGKCLIDRFAMASGYEGITLNLVGMDGLRDLMADPGKGFILLTAHVGNWQVAMTALRGFGRPVNLMMRREDNQAVKQALSLYEGDDQVRFIFTDDPLDGVIEAMKAIDRGELVSVMGDRAYDFSAIETNFLGDNVRFPYGAFSIASAARCPVVVLLSAKTGARTYLVDVSHVIAAPAGGRKKMDGIINATREFAGVLEEYVTTYPFQWFVFRDIWKSND